MNWMPSKTARVLWTLSAIRLTHPALSVYLKKMVATDDLWEVRVIFAGNIFRLLGWMEGRRNFYSVKVEDYFWGRSAGFMLR